MVWGILFTIIVILVGAVLVNGKDSESSGQAVVGFIVMSAIIGFIMLVINLLLDSCTK